jgi:hypothetical protein
MPSKSKVICALSLYNKSCPSRPQDNQEGRELMLYFMLSKIAFSGYGEGAASLISSGPDNGHMSL